MSYSYSYVICGSSGVQITQFSPSTSVILILHETEMYAGRVVCCSLLSHVEYAPCALLRLEKNGTDRRTDRRQTVTLRSLRLPLYAANSYMSVSIWYFNLRLNCSDLRFESRFASKKLGLAWDFTLEACVPLWLVTTFYCNSTVTIVNTIKTIIDLLYTKRCFSRLVMSCTQHCDKIQTA